MPNAKNAHVENSRKGILVLGSGGSGKTQQFLTLPGPKFAYLFDPGALATLEGHDVEYEEYIPDTLDLTVKSLSSKPAASPKASKLKPDYVYQEWEKHFEDGIQKGFFDQFDNIMLDSLTTFSDAVMDEVLRQNGRVGSWPNQDDYAPQMNAIGKIVKMMLSMNKRVYITGHHELVKDDISGRVSYQPLLTGKLKQKLPLWFSQIFSTFAESSTDRSVKYVLQTKPDRQVPLIRTSIKGLEYKEDVTLDFSKPLEGQGLGGIILRHEQSAVNAGLVRL